eukprot:TRINITY_DN7179_c0_g1_i2.p1 TRINITY_DN7179_c0_g1~~TRINITY_DN7179_c0_g1_i2.p1  ORF type:complete len:154 (+),score=20.21 TRINITY_DN7179_c0_g1_i2:40-501(+)
MRRFGLILTIVLFGVLGCVGQSLPAFPPQFWTQIEINLLERNETVRRAEYYDYVNNKERIDFYGERGSIIEILDVSNDARYELRNFSSCAVYPLNDTFYNRIDTISHHLRNTTSLFRYDSGNVTKLDTVETARGIYCDVWVAEVSEMENYTDP